MLHMQSKSMSRQLSPSASCRFSAVIQNGKFKTFNVERDGIELNCSLAAIAHKQLEETSGKMQA